MDTTEDEIVSSRIEPPDAPGSMRMGNLHVSANPGPIFEAIAKAQAAMDAASKDAENPHFRSKYADLAAVWDVLRPTLSAAGVATVQAPGIRDKAIVITTLLGHGSGAWMWADLPMPLAQWSAQAIGSGITYGRRYALSAMCGVAPADDEDGNAASAGAPAKPPERERKEERKEADDGAVIASYGPHKGQPHTAWSNSAITDHMVKLAAKVDEPDADPKAVPKMALQFNKLGTELLSRLRKSLPSLGGDDLAKVMRTYSKMHDDETTPKRMRAFCEELLATISDARKTRTQTEDPAPPPETT